MNAAICNPCFELWLLLHHAGENDCGGLVKCRDVEVMLRDILGGYNKRHLQPGQFSRALVADACARARRLGEFPAWSIPASIAAPVYLILEAIAAGASPHQLPTEFACLVR